MRRKWIPVLLALLVLFSYTLTARAATISDTGWESTPSTEWGSNDTATCTNGKITLTATGYKAIISSYSRTSSLTLKNNTGLKQILSGDMIFEGSGSYTITLPDGSEVNGSGNYTHKASITMESGQSLTISVTSPKSNGAIMKCSYAPTVTESSEKTITCNTASNGTYTVNGNTTTSVSFEVGDTLTLVADPDDGYVCLGFWLDGTTMLPMPSSASLNWVPTDSHSITPIFAQVANTSAPFSVNDKNYYTWETAMWAAGSSGTVVLTDDYTLPTDLAGNGLSANGTYVKYDTTTKIITYSIPSGVTFLAPYSPDDTTVQTSTTIVDGKYSSTLKYANMTLICAANDGTDLVRNGLFLADVDVTYTLTIPSGTTLNVDSGGKFVIGGTIAAGNRSTAGISCATSGAHSNVELEGTLNVNGDMSVCGYILGGGQVNINNGGTVYQPFTLMDYINGPYVKRSADDDTWPFYRYAVINIQSNVRIVYGGSIRGYIDLYTAAILFLDDRHNVTEFDFISSTGMFRLGTNTTLDITYDPDCYANDTDTAHRDQGMYHRIGKTTMTFNGDVTFGYTSLVLEIQGTKYPVDTTGDHFAIPYNYDIVLNSGTFSLPYMLKILPGSTMTVNSGATVKVADGGSLGIMTGLRDHRVYAATSDTSAWYNEHYPSTEVLQAEPFSSNGSANLILNGGTLQVETGGSFGGLVQTTGSGTVIMDGTASTTVHIGVLNESNSVTGDLTGRGEYVLPAQVYGLHGDLINITSGQRFVAENKDEHTIASYAYTVYTSSTSDTTTSMTQTLNAKVTGEWKCQTCEEHTSEVTNPTCLEGGYTTHTCTVCGHSYTDSEVAALGHDYGEYTFDAETYYSTAACHCGDEDKVYTPVRFAAIQLSAESEVLLKFKFFISPDLLAQDAAYIRITEAANEVTKEDQIAEYTMAQIREMETDNERYVLSQGIAAGEMTGIVSVEVFDANDNPLSISVYQDNSVSTVLDRTVVDYSRLALASQKETMRALSAAMVTFGGYAQAFYGVDAEHPAYAILEQEFPNLAFDEKYHGFDVNKISGETINQVLTINGLASDDTTSISTETGSSFGIAYDAQKINLDSRVSMTTYFILDEGADINDYTFTLTYTQDGKDGLEMELTAAKEADGRYSVKIVDIPVAYWDYMYKLTITKVDSDEEYVVESSILAWARRCILNSTKEDQVNMAKAMYYYNLAANDYFGK